MALKIFGIDEVVTEKGIKGFCARYIVIFKSVNVNIRHDYFFPFSENHFVSCIGVTAEVEKAESFFKEFDAAVMGMITKRGD